MRRGEPAKGGKGGWDEGFKRHSGDNEKPQRAFATGNIHRGIGLRELWEWGKILEDRERNHGDEEEPRSVGGATDGGGGAQRWAQPKRELAVKGELEPQFLRPSDSLSGSSGFGKSPRPQ